MIAITNAQIVLEHSIIDNGTIIVDGDKITDCGSADTVLIPNTAEIYDAKGLYAGPGFVDIHVHGGGGYLFSHEPFNAAEHFLKHGETTVLPTLYYDLDKQGFLDSIKRIRAASNQGGAGNAIGGIYMEGPYMNPKYGASPEKNKWRGEIIEDAYKEVVEAAGTLAKVWVIAPEREGIRPFIEKVKDVNPDAVISVGHSEATPSQVAALKKYGISLQTHCMNATGRPDCPGGTRSCGPDEACLIDKDIYLEVICDSLGVHVSPDMIKYIIAIKGMDKVVLITDSFVSADPTPEKFSHITDLQFDANGGLCGSKLTMDMVCKNIVKHIGCSVNDAFIMASRNPARVIGMDNEIGTIEIGKKANIVLVDDDFNVKKVMLQGKFY